MVRIAAATICLEGFEDTDFKNTFDLLPKTGIKFIEFNAWYPQNLTAMKLREIKRRCESADLFPAVLHGQRFGGNLTKDICHKLHLIDAANMLGIRRICMTGEKRGTEGGLEHIIALLKEVVPYAEEKDTLICLENHANNNLEFIEDYEQIFKEIDSSYLGVCLDDGHLDAAGVDIDEFIDRLGDKINHIHMKDNKGKGTMNFVKFGEGDTDHKNIVKRMFERGYEGYITIEISPRKDCPTTYEDLTHAKNEIEKMIKECENDG